jgi:ferredoxin
MNWLSTAERLAAIYRSAVRYDPQACLCSRNRAAGCEACLGLCPSEAIQPGKPPALDPARCERCLACLPACPYAAYSADDSVLPLLTSAARIESPSLELVCERHPAPEQGFPDGAAVRVRGCLAGLGAGALLALVSLGFERVRLRTDACPDCSWSGPAARLLDQVRLAGAVLEAYARAGALQAVEAAGELAVRPLWDAHNPPLSRRDLFRMASRQGQIAAARALVQESEAGQPHLGRERWRLNQAVSRLSAAAAPLDVSLAGLGFALLAVSPACTACGVCGRACPTTALELREEAGLREQAKQFELVFNPALCTGCGLCRETCAPGVLALDPDPSFLQVFGGEITLRSGVLVSCERCGARIAARQDSQLCPLCEFRRKNPFGSRLPPGWKAAEGRPQ